MLRVMDETRTAGPRIVAADAPIPIAVTVLHSPDSGVLGLSRRIERRFTVGRRGGDGLDLPIDDPALSRSHLRIERRRGARRVGVVDLGSKNGTFVAGVPVQRVGVDPGTAVVVGDTVLWIGAPPEVVPERGGLGSSPAWAAVCRTVDRVAPTTATVLLVGETGAGKEVAARRLHRGSGRKGDFRAVNCAAIPVALAESLLFGHTAGAFTGAKRAQDGQFVAADGGTLFLDELGELPMPVQAKLLRVVETGGVLPVGGLRERPVDVRLVAATCVELGQAVTDGRFRRDLYARLAQVPVRLPPLRERPLDIPLLARAFLDEAGCSRPWTAGFVCRLLEHPWTLNVRGLRSAMQRVALLYDGEVIEADALGEPDRASGLEPRGDDPLARLPALVEAHRGNIARVAEALGKDRKQVYRWVRRLGIDLDDYR